MIGGINYVFFSLAIASVSKYRTNQREELGACSDNGKSRTQAPEAIASRSQCVSGVDAGGVCHGSPKIG